MVDEIVRQSILFKNDGDLFKRYINEYTVSCLIDNVMMTNMTKCTDGVTKFLSEVVDTDIGRTLMNNNSVVHKTVLETNMASIEKYRSDPSEFQISVNNQFVKVAPLNLGRIHWRETSGFNLYGLEPSSRLVPTKDFKLDKQGHLKCLHFSV